MGNLEVISFLRHPLCLSSGHFPAAYLCKDAALRDNIYTVPASLEKPTPIKLQWENISQAHQIPGTFS